MSIWCALVGGSKVENAESIAVCDTPDVHLQGAKYIHFYAQDALFTRRSHWIVNMLIRCALSVVQFLSIFTLRE